MGNPARDESKTAVPSGAMFSWSSGEQLYADEPTPRVGSLGGGSHVPSEAGTTIPMPSNIQAFIQEFLPLAENQFDVYGIPVSVQLALGGIESGCGIGSGPWALTPQNNNWFNITNDLNQDVVVGDPFTTSAFLCSATGRWYRQYATPEDAWLALGFFLRNDSNYSNVQQHLGTPRLFLSEMYRIFACGRQAVTCPPVGVIQSIWDDRTNPYDLTVAMDIPSQLVTTSTSCRFTWWR